MILSSENKDNKITIDNYIRDNDCKINQTRTEYLNGEAIVLQGYRLPRELLYYNIKNGRFAKEYIKIIRDEGGSLDPEDPDDEKKIQTLLLSGLEVWGLSLGRFYQRMDLMLCSLIPTVNTLNP